MSLAGADTPENPVNEKQETPIDPATFWLSGATLDEFKVSFDETPDKEAILNVLVRPPFWDDQLDFFQIYRSIYREISRKAQNLARN